MISAIKSDDPVLFLKPKALLRAKGEEAIPGEPADEKALKDMIDAPIGDRSKWKAKWPKLTDYSVEIGKAKISHPGSDATVVTHGRMAPLCLAAARKFAAEGRGSVEVIDLRSLIPYDWEAIKASVKKTGRVLFVNEETEITNFGEHLIRRVVDELFYELKVRPRLLAGKATPGIALSPNLEYFIQPQAKDCERAIAELLADPA
jgi:2-oxoisovalerate dehydrogenase E1 component beta subunit